MIMSALSVVVTAVLYFVLRYFGTANLLFSTISVTTSFIAAYLTYLRSPYYGLGYASNDIVLIVLWVLMSIEDISYLPMIACFVAFAAATQTRKQEKKIYESAYVNGATLMFA